MVNYAASNDNPEGSSGSEDSKDKEEDYRKHHQYREGQTQLEIISTGTERYQLIDAGRTFMNGFEDMSLHPDGSVSEYRLEDAIALVGNRKADMSYSRQDLLDLGYLLLRKELKRNEDTREIEETGKIVETLTYPGFAYTSKIETLEHEKKILTPQRTLHHIEVEEEPIQVFVAGTDSQRKELYRNLDKIQSEMTSREDLVKKLRWVWNQTENLEGLVQFYFMGSLTQEAMDALCNSEGRTVPDRMIEGKRTPALMKTEGGAEYREGCELGDAIGVALQCFEIAALSEKPGEFEALLKRPGIKFLFKVKDQEIDDLFIPPDKRPDRVLNPSLVKWIGEPWTWNKGVGVDRNDNLAKGGKPAELNIRGRLTERGNVLVEPKPGDLEYIYQQIERFLGGGDAAPNLAAKDARDARFIAWGLLRVTGEASDIGNQWYRARKDNYYLGVKKDTIYPHHDMGGMTSCDRVKVIAPNIFRKIYRYVKTEIRGFGPDGSLDKYPDRFTVPYLKNWSVDVETDKFGGKDVIHHLYDTKWLKTNSNGEKILSKRTFDEMRWGYRAGVVKDRLAIEDGVTKKLPEEPAYRLGELPWKLLSPKTFNSAALGPFIAGREKVGLFQLMMRTDWDIHELKEKSFFERLGQYMGIAMNKQTVFDGRFRGVNDIVMHPDGVIEKIQNDGTINEDEVVRNYKKKYLLAFWDGIRSLPQYREWIAAPLDSVKDKPGFGNPQSREAIKRMKYRIGRTGIISPEEARNLPEESLVKDDFA